MYDRYTEQYRRYRNRERYIDWLNQREFSGRGERERAANSEAGVALGVKSVEQSKKVRELLESIKAEELAEAAAHRQMRDQKNKGKTITDKTLEWRERTADETEDDDTMSTPEGSKLFAGIRKLVRLFDDVASVTGLDQRADVRKTRKQFEQFIHMYKDLVNVTGTVKNDIESGIEKFISGSLSKNTRDKYDQLNDYVQKKMAIYREKLDGKLRYDGYTKKMRVLTEEDIENDAKMETGNYVWDHNKNTILPTREYLKQMGDANSIAMIPKMNNIELLQNDEMERNSIRNHKGYLNYIGEQTGKYLNTRDVKIRKIAMGRDPAMTSVFGWLQGSSDSAKIDFVEKQNANVVYGNYFPVDFFNGGKRTMRNLFDFFTSAQSVVTSAEAFGFVLPPQVSVGFAVGRGLSAAGMVGEIATGTEEVGTDDAGGLAFITSRAAQVAKTLGFMDEDLADAVSNNADTVEKINKVVRGAKRILGVGADKEEKKDNQQTSVAPTKQPFMQRMFGPSTDQPSIGAPSSGAGQPSIGAPDVGGGQASIEAPSSGGGGGGPQCAAGDDEIRYNMNTQSNSAFPRRPNEPGAPGTGLGQSYKATPPFTSGTHHDDTGDKFNDVQDVYNSENNLRVEFGEASARSVIPTVEKQMESDIRFDMFDLVHPGFGEGADNKLFLMQERREEAIVHMELHFFPGDSIGQLNGFNVPPWQLQREMPVDEVRAYSDRKRKEVYDKAAVFRMYDDASTNVLGDDVGYPYTHSAGELKRARYSPFEPVIRTDMDWQHVKNPTGVKLNKLGMRRTYDALREPRNLRCDISQAGGPRLEPRRSLEVILQ